jgi:hypothetical protein
MERNGCRSVRARAPAWAQRGTGALPADRSESAGARRRTAEERRRWLALEGQTSQGCPKDPDQPRQKPSEGWKTRLRSRAPKQFPLRPLGRPTRPSSLPNRELCVPEAVIGDIRMRAGLTERAKETGAPLAVGSSDARPRAAGSAAAATGASDLPTAAVKGKDNSSLETAGGSVEAADAAGAPAGASAATGGLTVTGASSRSASTSIGTEVAAIDTDVGAAGTSGSASSSDSS